jgi:choline transport protein
LTDSIGAEVKDAERRVPQSMLTSVIVNGGLCFAFIIAILFTIGDPVAAASSPTGYPIIEILFQATNSNRATTGLMSLLVLMGIIALFGTLASVSRLVWAFARDGGLPFEKFFSNVGFYFEIHMCLYLLTLSRYIQPYESRLMLCSL